MREIFLALSNVFGHLGQATTNYLIMVDYSFAQNGATMRSDRHIGM